MARRITQASGDTQCESSFYPLESSFVPLDSPTRAPDSPIRPRGLLKEEITKYNSSIRNISTSCTYFAPCASCGYCISCTSCVSHLIYKMYNRPLPVDTSIILPKQNIDFPLASSDILKPPFENISTKTIHVKVIVANKENEFKKKITGGTTN